MNLSDFKGHVLANLSQINTFAEVFPVECIILYFKLATETIFKRWNKKKLSFKTLFL